MTMDAVPEDVWGMCTLPTAQRPVRLGEFDQLFAESVLSSSRPGPTVLRLVLRAESEPTARHLAARESECCSFFSFDFATAGTDVVMTVEVPPARVEILDALADRAR